MRITDNVRTMCSTVAGLLGGGVSMAGWAAKAATPASASLGVKSTVAATVAVAVGGTSFGILQGFLPTTLAMGGSELTLHSSLVGNYVVATWSGLCAAVSYTVGVAHDGGGKARSSALGARAASRRRT